MCCNLPLLFLSQMVKKKFLIFFCDLAMMMMKIDESKLSNYFEFINARGFDFFWLSLFTRYSPGLYMIGRVRNRNFLLKSMLFSGLKDEILKSVLSEIWHIWVQLFSCQKNRPLIGWPIRQVVFSLKYYILPIRGLRVFFAGNH